MADESMQLQNETTQGVDGRTKNETEQTIDVEQEVSQETEELESDDEMEEDAAKCEAIQAAVALEVRAWLEEHGAKLYALEHSKKSVRDQKAALKQGPVSQWLQTEDKKRQRDVPMESDIKQEGNKRRRIGSRSK